MFFSHATIVSCPSTNPRLRRLPWVLILGVLILLCVRFADASGNAVLQVLTPAAMIDVVFVRGWALGLAGVWLLLWPSN